MNKGKKPTPYQSDTFFEAFRELGRQTSKSGVDALSDIGSDVVSQVLPGAQPRGSISGELRPNEAVSLEAELRRREAEAVRSERAHLQKVRRQEQLVFSRKERELRRQIEAIQEELRKIISEASDFASEMEVAVEQTVVEPGVYHLNFFERLRQLIVLLRRKIVDSRTWMHTVNQRASKRSYFWAQVGRSGTKFLLSQERYMSTQAG